MDALRFVPRDQVDPSEPCSRCGASGCRWDRLGERPCCPDCQERLAQGVADPFVALTHKRPCAVCGRNASLGLLTFPLGSKSAVEMDLCPNHFRALLGRSLDPRGYRALRRRLEALRLTPRNVFLLHEAFYDDLGRALQPVTV